jgi:hypothetical protein
MKEQGHVTSAEWTAYRQGTLALAALLEISDHVQECVGCRDELRQNQRAAPAVKAAGYENLVAWMEGDIDPLRRHELAESIGNSPADAAELANLLQFREQMNELPAHDYSTSVLPRSQWNLGRLLPLAAGLAAGCALLWWISAGHRAGDDVAFVDHGQRLVVRRNGEIPARGPLPPALQRSVRDGVSLGRVERPTWLTELRGSRETLAGRAAAERPFRVIAPVGSVVEAERPVFRWSREPGATDYRVNLVTTGGAVVSSPLLPASATTWLPNESLLPNETYGWEVEALQNGELLAKTPAPPEPEARFRVLDATSRTELNQLREKWSASHLVMGLAYAKTGLVADAQREFEELAQENPQSALPTKLLDSLTNGKD